MDIVVALGGNALLQRGEPLEAALQRRNAAVAARAIAEIARSHRVVLTHGNGPQVGLLALQNEAYQAVAGYPLDILDAESAGMVGYVLQQELGRYLDPRRLATLLTQVIVRADDPAFRRPTKPVGPLYTEIEAAALATDRGWSVARDGNAWRRVVSSPEPIEIVELPAIRTLVERGFLVTCAGGGGVPVVADTGRGLRGVEAVIDKDLSAARLAIDVQADALLLLTDVDAVYRDWGTPRQRPIRHAGIDELRQLAAAPGSMGPKVEAVCRFVDAGGSIGAIGTLRDAAAILRGDAGTIVRPRRAAA